MKYLHAIKNILVIVMIISFFLSITSNVFAVSTTGDIDLFNYYYVAETQAQNTYVKQVYLYMQRYHSIPTQFILLATDLKNNDRIVYFYNASNGNLSGRSNRYIEGGHENEVTIYVFNNSDIKIDSNVFQAGVWLPGISAGITGDMTYPCYRIAAKKSSIIYNNKFAGDTFYYNSNNECYYDTTVTCNIPRGTVIYTNEFQELLNKYYAGTLYEEASNPDLITLLKEMGEEEEQQTEDLDKIKQDVSQMKNDVNETKNFIKDTNKSVDTNLPSSSGADDPTSSGFNNIFMRFYNAMTSDSASDIITVPIPYANRSFDLNPIFVRSWWNQLGIIKDMVSAVWYFLVGLYIAKDIHKIIHDIQDGSIMTKTDTDVKTEML